MTTLILSGGDALLGRATSAATAWAKSGLNSLFSGGSDKDSVRTTEGPRLTDMPGLQSTEGAAIPRLYGRARIGGQLIWATRFEEVVTTTTGVQRTSSRGGKSLGSSTSTKTTVSTTYSYYGNVAVGLCEGAIAFVRRVWADGQEVDLAGLTMRVYPGDETQEPDPLIVAKEGDAPAYRGRAYVVFERLPLADFGNRVPQFSFEVVRPLPGLPDMVRSVCLIPGATEFGYDTGAVQRVLGLGSSTPENTHQYSGATDVMASLDQLQALCPNLRHVSLVVSWFGDDLRAGSCTIRPKVDLSDKATSGAQWSVAGLDRSTAAATSRFGEAAAYGGTPSDDGVVRLIVELKRRGLAVTLYPFVMMDVPPGNGLPDPHGGAEQAAYPWRGRITCMPAPGLPGSPDSTAEAAAEVAAFFGAAAPAAFATGAGRVVYAGPEEWSFRRLALHYAALVSLAGGVDAFVIGSELVGLTRVRSGPGSYPAVAQLRALAADLKAMLGAGTELVYAADWTEYGAHVRDGGRELRFPLDPLWADPNVDAVGIDWYPPVSDWRDGAAHLDLAEARSAADRDYLRARCASGEAFDWYYAGEADRTAQRRTPITDGAYGKPWCFRAKDVLGWWSNPHVERVDGVETGATAWVPGGKPIWLTELGFPAVDKGANGPNVFPDPKSSESALPPFSSGARDDLLQTRALEAVLSRLDPGADGFVETGNPVASSYPGRAIDPARASIWCWDARPFPAFPDFDGVWADGANWRTGHWITGRIEGAPLDRLVTAILADLDLPPGDTSRLDGFVQGYVIDRPMSVRDAIEPLAELFGVDAVASAGDVVWRSGGGDVAASFGPDEVAASGDEPLIVRVRAQETDLPAELGVSFTNADGEYSRAEIASRRLAGTSRRQATHSVAAVLDTAAARDLAERGLQELWAGRETITLSLSTREIALEPGDIVRVGEGASGDLYRITRIADGSLRHVEARSVEPGLYRPGAAQATAGRVRQPPGIAGPPAAMLVDLAAAPEQPEPLAYLAVAADPWPGSIAVWRAPGDGGDFVPLTNAVAPSILGRTITALPPGPLWRWDRASSVIVELSGGSLATVSELSALGGETVLAIEGPDGAWEILSARVAELVASRRYRLSGLIRGLGGSEAAAGRPVAAGARVVRLDGALLPLTRDPADLGRTYRYRIVPAGRDPLDTSAVELTGTVSAAALLPLSPVRLAARRESGGIALSWIRRTRIGGDSWDVAEVPLGEEVEAYEVDLLSPGGAVVRTLSSSTPECLYPATAEAADFGGPQTSLAVVVAQMSRAASRGTPAAATLPVR